MRRLLTFLFIVSFAGMGSGQDLNKTVLDSIVSESQKTNTDALIIYKNGQPVFKSYFGKPVKKIEAMSATKSVVALAIGLLVDKGFLKDIDQTVSKYYPEWKQGRKKNITIRQLLDHTSGLQNVANAGVEVEVAPDVIKLALAAELDSEPGTVFSYNNKATNLLAGIVEKASGMKMDVFLKKYLFDEIGIKDFDWRIDEQGNPLGMAGLQIFPEDFAKIGQLVLNKGTWNNKRIISENQINAMMSPNPLKEENGLLWWLMYDKQFMVIDEDLLGKMKPKPDAETYALLERIKGRYEGMQAIQAKLRSAYTEKELPAVIKAFSSTSPSEMRIENEGEIIGYAAIGYLGQQLIILPKRNIVIVRMISAGSYKKIPNNSEFVQLKRLAKQL